METSAHTPYTPTPGCLPAADRADTQDGDVCELTRLQILKEWIRNESEFLLCLESIHQQISAPILDHVHLNPLCCDSVPGLPIFLSLIKMLQAAHSQLLQQLEEIASSWCDQSSRIGDVVNHHIGIIRNFLRPYSCGVGVVTASIRRCILQQSFTFLSAVAAANPNMDALKHLSVPLSRLPYYEFTLRRLLSRTERNHGDHAPLTKAIKFVRTASKRISTVNEVCRQHQSICVLEQILGMNLIKTNRVLLLQGELMCSFDYRDDPAPAKSKLVISLSRMVTNKQRAFLSDKLREHPVFVALFNDIIILSRKLPEGSLSVFDIVPLDTCSISVSETFKQKILNVKCRDGRVFHLHSLQAGESSRWVDLVFKAHSNIAMEEDNADEFCIDVVYRNEFCQLRVVQQHVVVSGFDEDRPERARLNLRNLRLFYDDADECIIQFSSASKHILVFVKSDLDANRIIQYVRLEQIRISSLLPEPAACCERSRARSIWVKHQSCSICNSYIICSACLSTATLINARGKSRSVACKACQMAHFRKTVACSIPEAIDWSRNGGERECFSAEVGFYEARRIRHNRRLGILRLADLDTKSPIGSPRFPNQCLSLPLLKLRDDLGRQPQEIPVSEAVIPRVQCASCLEFKTVDNGNHFWGVCGHKDDLVNDRIAFLFTFVHCEKALVKQQISLFNSYFSPILNDINEPTYQTGLIYCPPSFPAVIRFGKTSPFVASHLSFMLEGRFAGKEMRRQPFSRLWLNSGAASFCVTLRMLLGLLSLMLGELEDRLKAWTADSQIAEILLRYFPHVFACFRCLISNYHEAMKQFVSTAWRFQFEHFQARYNIATSVFDMLLMTFDRIHAFYLILYKENSTEGGCYHHELLQMSGGLILLINRVLERNTFSAGK